MDGDVEKGDGDVSSGCVFFNIPIISQCKYSSTFKEMDKYVENSDDDVSNGYGFINSRILYQC